MHLNQEDSVVVAVVVNPAVAVVLVAGDRLGHPAVKGLAEEAAQDLAVVVNPAVADPVVAVADEGLAEAAVDSAASTTVRP